MEMVKKLRPLKKLISAHIKVSQHKRIECLINKGFYRSKSHFLDEAIRRELQYTMGDE